LGLIDQDKAHNPGIMSFSLIKRKRDCASSFDFRLLGDIPIPGQVLLRSGSAGFRHVLQVGLLSYTSEWLMKLMVVAEVTPTKD
jgi:hypothetical protein